jgi:hypothetical protein
VVENVDKVSTLIIFGEYVAVFGVIRWHAYRQRALELNERKSSYARRYSGRAECQHRLSDRDCVHWSGRFAFRRE